VALDRRSPLSLAVAEAVRLRSPGVDLRMAAGNAVLPTADGRGLAVRKACCAATVIVPFTSECTTSIGQIVLYSAHRATLLDTGGKKLFCHMQGQLLAVSPYESHLDERLYGPRAHAYDPQRAELDAITGVAGIGGIAGFAFGGGRYR